MRDDPLRALRLRRATSSRDRLVGLLAGPPIAEDEGLVLEPCDAIHTFAMRFPIDVVFLDRSGRVMRVVERLAPWRIAWTPGARTVIETAAGTASRIGLVRGLTLTVP